MSAVQLVNNLDLEVFYQQTGLTHLGNAGVYAGTGPDVRNPVETVNLAAVTNGDMDIQVVVRARAINVGASQPYSLVVTGSVRPSTCARTKDVDIGLATDGQLFSEGVTPIISTRPGSNLTAPAERLAPSEAFPSGEKARTFGLTEMVAVAL